MPSFNPIAQELAFTLLLQASNGGPSGLLSEYVREGGPSDVYVKPSPIHGEGLFARRTFATGETILIREERPVISDQPLDPAHGEFEHHCERLDGGRVVYLGYPARHINHSCEPNAFLRRHNGLNHLVALRPIRPNEEIVRHYGVNLWGGEPWTCNCGSERCIGSIPGDFFSLPLDVQIELSPLLAPWFVFEHRDLHRAFLREAGLTEDEIS
jgi:SET domain-containing protein